MPAISVIYHNLRKLARAFGFNLALVRIGKNKGEYEVSTPHATYAPWLSDKEFISTFNIIEKYTLVDMYRCYELWNLVAESKKIPGAIIEIGTWRGGSAALIAKSAELNNINDTIYFCDTFTGVVKAGEQDTTYSGGEHSDASKELVEEVINKLELKSTKILSGIFPDETAKEVSDEKFRFCHIDVDVYQSARDVVDWIWPKLSVGGIIVYDDYGFSDCPGITRLVNEERKKEDRIVVHNLNGHAIVIKTK